MSQQDEFTTLLHAIAEKSMHFFTQLQNNPEARMSLIKHYIEFTEYLYQLAVLVSTDPQKVWLMNLSYWQQAATLAQNQLTHWLQGKPFPTTDQRFAHEDWQNNPLFNFMSHQYLLASQHINLLLQQKEYDNLPAIKKLRFFSQRYLDALSPTNFIATNPTLVTETIQSRGKNLLKGLHNLLSDLEHDASALYIKMTDKSAFKVGENLACTPGQVIFRNEMMELIQYTPTTEDVFSVPLLIIPPWINKYYILDLSPHNSLVRWLVSQGIRVFIISWVNPDAKLAHKDLFDYLHEGPQTALEVIKKQLSCKQVNALGFCIGGTLLTLLLAYHKAHACKDIKSATFLASLIDFSDPGDIAAFIDEQQINQLEKEMHKKGYLPGKFMVDSFNSLRANDLIWSFFIKNYLQGQSPVPFDILYWNSDCTNMPAAMHSSYLRTMYLNNDLIKPNKIILNNTPIDITQITTPTFFLSTEKDHIAPWKTTYLGFQLMKGPKRFVLGGSGHIAGIINAPNSNKYTYKTLAKNTLTADEWYQKAKTHQGSWWPEWYQWLTTRSGKRITAPQNATLPYTALAEAPGTYVFVPSEAG